MPVELAIDIAVGGLALIKSVGDLGALVGPVRPVWRAPRAAISVPRNSGMPAARQADGASAVGPAARSPPRAAISLKRHCRIAVPVPG
jgi:hypothetical protein